MFVKAGVFVAQRIATLLRHGVCIEKMFAAVSASASQESRI